MAEAYKPLEIQRRAHRALLVEGYKRALLYWSRRTGKALALSTPLLTPFGFKTVGTVEVGDYVFAPDGKPTLVQYVSPIYTGRQCYEVEFSDGSVIVADASHDWVVETPSSRRGVGKPQKLTTEELAGDLFHKRSDGRLSKKYSIPLPTPLALPESDLAVEPYFLGLWLGDGNSRDAGVTTPDPAIAEYLHDYADRLGLSVTTPSVHNTGQATTYQIVDKGSGGDYRKIFTLTGQLRKLGILHNKHIPESYLMGSHQQRMAVLEGLVDSDGCVYPSGQVEYSTKSPRLANDIVFLLRSLGIRARVIKHESRLYGRLCGYRYRINFVVGFPVARLERKRHVSKKTNRAAACRIFITAIRSVGSVPVRCIGVADESHLFLAGRSLIATHNTRWSLQQLMFSCMLHQGPHHIVFKEYQQAETVAWNQYLHTIPQELIQKTDKSTLTITFHYLDGTIKFPDPIGTVEIHADYSKPPATIRLLGSDKADSHRGGESYGMIFDEYQDQDPAGWDFVYKYFLATTDGWACFMGTAKEADHWNEMLDRAVQSERWYFSKATWRENPLIKPEWIETERKEAEAEHRLGPFLQETELIPFSQQGAVYPMFNKDIHVIKPDQVPDEGTDYIALDFGFAEGHPMAACFIRITRDDVWYQYDEIHGSGIQLDDAIAEIRIKLGDRKLTAIIADSARPDLIEYMQSKAFPVIPAPKSQNSIASGIQLLAKRLRPKIQVIGEPKPNYYVTNNCKNTIYDFVHYRYKEVKENRHPMENPEKRFDDSLDAIRYLALWFRFGVKPQDKIPTSSALKEMSGEYNF